MDGSQREKPMPCVHVHILATMVVRLQTMMKSMLRYHSFCYEHIAGSLVMFDNLSNYLLISFASTFVFPLMNG
jgi:hypothetical protein